MNHTTINIFPPVLTSKLLAAAAPSPGSPSWCSDELVAFSPSTDTATSRCCDALSKALNSGDGNLIALPSVCALSSSVSVDLLCSESLFPPIPGTTTKLPPESVDGSPKSPGSHSSEEKHNSNNWFLPVVLTFIVILNTCNAAIVIYLPFDWHLKLFYHNIITAIAGVYRQI
ncbi:non-specific lipid-transfer protein [Salix suchowensis]|nr:non-specific lipid-transfer protein [Salix suchowensis]